MSPGKVFLFFLFQLSWSICNSQSISWKNANIVSDIKPGWFYRYDHFIVISDNNGNSYCLGNYEKDTDEYSSPIAQKVKERSGTFIRKFDNAGELVWAIDIGAVKKLMIDGDGNLYTAGITIENGDNNKNSIKTRCFLTRISDAGEIIWTNTMTEENSTIPYELYVDENKKIQVVFGTYSQTENYPGSGTTDVNGKIIERTQLKVRHVFSDGKFGNIRELKGASFSNDCIDRVYYDKGLLYLAGNFYTELRIGDTTFTTERMNNAYIAIFQNEKFKQGIRFSREQNADKFYFPFPKFAFGEDGSIYIGGTYSMTARFGHLSLRGSGKENGFVTKYNASGKPIWAKSIGLPQSALSDGATVNAIALDNNGNLWFTGKFCDELTLGKKFYLAKKSTEPTLSDPKRYQIADLYIACADSAGNIFESMVVTGPSGKTPIDIFPDKNNNITLLGGFSLQTLYFDQHVVSSGGISTFIARFGTEQLQVSRTSTYNKASRATNIKDETNKESRYQSQKWAVVIGISDYQNSNTTDLRYADLDAKLFYDFLTSKEGGSVPKEQIVLLTGRDATRTSIISALSETFRQAIESDMIIFYFASHGYVVEESKELFLLPFDANSDEIEGTSVSETDIQKYIGRSKAGKKLIIADACHSGNLGLDKMNRSNSSSSINQKLMQLTTYKNGSVIISASSSSGVSKEFSELKHGAFTYYLVEGLRGKADVNNDRLISIREAFNYVNKKVVTFTNGIQHPELKGVFSDDMPLGGIPDNTK